jgi:hypothetical protein
MARLCMVAIVISHPWKSAKFHSSGIAWRDEVNSSMLLMTKTLIVNVIFEVSIYCVSVYRAQPLKIIPWRHYD